MRNTKIHFTQAISSKIEKKQSNISCKLKLYPFSW